MKHNILQSIILITLLTNPAAALTETLAWSTVKEMANDTAVAAVQELFKEAVKPAEVAALRRRIAELQQQLAVSETQRNYPSYQQLHSVKQLVASLNNIVNTLSHLRTSVEQRLSPVENDLLAIRQSLLAMRQSKGPQSIQPDPLDFQINYVYRRRGQRHFQPLTDGGTLYSGSYYKIIFTPAEDCYIYLFQIDSAKQLYRLFPLKSFGAVTVNHTNPVQAGKTYYLPGEHQSFELDQQIGQETLYFVASHQPDIVLENQYQAYLQAQQQQNHSLAQQVQSQITQTMRNSKGLQRVEEEELGNLTTWQEQGQAFSVLRTKLEDLCNGCVDTLTFKHR